MHCWWGLDNGRIMPGLDLNPTSVSKRAAWLSYGFLLRNAAAPFLDVDRSEFRVGLRTLRWRGRLEAEEFFRTSGKTERGTQPTSVSKTIPTDSGRLTWPIRPAAILALKSSTVMPEPILAWNGPRRSEAFMSRVTLM
jgi:hypothetical protein